MVLARKAGGLGSANHGILRSVLSFEPWSKSLAGYLGATSARTSAKSELQPEASGHNPADAEQSAPADGIGVLRQNLNSQKGCWTGPP